MPLISAMSSKSLTGAAIVPPTTPAIFLPYRIDNPLTTGTFSFGRSVAISENLLIVGASADPNSTGVAYIFNLTTGQLLHTLTNPNVFGTVDNDQFGWSVAISGIYAVVGTSAEDETGNTNSGKAYVFKVTTGELLHVLNNPNAFGTSANDLFGHDCTISGTLIAIGSRDEDDAAGTSSGKVYIFNAVTGELQRTINNPNPFGTSTDDRFGYGNISMFGDYLVAGAWGEDPDGAGGAGSNSGVAYVFNARTGELIYTLLNPNGTGPINDVFGISTAISSKYIIVGAQNDDANGTDSGAAYIFSMSTGELVRTLLNPNVGGTTASDQFGSKVAITDDYAIVAAPGEDTPGNLSGAIYVFDIDTGNLLTTITPVQLYATAGAEFFGSSIAVSNKYTVFGAGNQTSPGYSSSSGKVYVYNNKNIVPFYPLLTIPRTLEVLKLAWNDGITNTVDLSPNARAVTNSGSGHTVVSTTGPYGTTDNVLRGSANGYISIASLNTAASNAIFTGSNSWSIEWWGRYDWQGDVGTIRSHRVWSQVPGVGASITVLAGHNDAMPFRLDVGICLNTGNLGTSFSIVNTPYVNNTWAHWVVAWEAVTATSGRLHLWINGVRCYNTLLDKPTSNDFFRTLDSPTVIGVNPFENQSFTSSQMVDFRILNTASVWTNLGSRFKTPAKSFST